MKYAIVESGGKQYKAVEGETIEVDRLPVNAGDKVDLERVLMLVDGDDIAVGTPTVGSTQVKTTVVDHFKGPKIIVFKYSPRKRIRVKSGHRQQYTRLMVNAIAKSKATKAKKAEAPAKKAEAKAEKKVEKKETTAAKPAAKKTEKAPATSSPKGKKAPAKKTEKTTAKKAPAKKTKKAPAKKTTTKKTTTKKTSSTKTTEK
jgi:large subunit ribosomal protein L21